MEYAQYKYRVLHLEDEFNDVYRKQAARVGVHLIHCKTGEDALERVRDRNEHFDGMILDVRGVRREGEVADEGGAIHDVLRETEKVREGLPAVIFSGGAAGGLENWNSVKKGFPEGMDVFLKGELGMKEVCLELVDQIEKRDETHVLKRYPELFEFLRESDELREYQNDILRLLSQSYGLKKPSAKDYQEDPFNRMRKILEAAFCICADKGLLPQDFVSKGRSQDNVDLRNCSKGLAGDSKNGIVEVGRKKFQFRDGILHPVMASQLQALIQCVGSQSHRENSKLFEVYRAAVPQNSLIGIHTFLLTDFISWLRRYLEAHADPVENQKAWKEISPVFNSDYEGEFTFKKVEKGGQFTNEDFPDNEVFAPTNIIKKQVPSGLSDGDLVEVGGIPGGLKNGKFEVTSIKKK